MSRRMATRKRARETQKEEEEDKPESEEQQPKVTVRRSARQSRKQDKEEKQEEEQKAEEQEVVEKKGNRRGVRKQGKEEDEDKQEEEQKEEDQEVAKKKGGKKRGKGEQEEEQEEEVVVSSKKKDTSKKLNKAEQDELFQRISAMLYEVGFPEKVCDKVATEVMRRSRTAQQAQTYTELGVRRCALYRQIVDPVWCDDLFDEMTRNPAFSGENVARATMYVKNTDEQFEAFATELKRLVEPHVVTDPEKKLAKEAARTFNEEFPRLWPGLYGPDWSVPKMVPERVSECEQWKQCAAKRIDQLYGLFKDRKLPAGLADKATGMLRQRAMDVSFTDDAWVQLIERVNVAKDCLSESLWPYRYSSSRDCSDYVWSVAHSFIFNGDQSDVLARLNVAIGEARTVGYSTSNEKIFRQLKNYVITGDDSVLAKLRWMWTDAENVCKGGTDLTTTTLSRRIRVSHCKQSALAVMACWRFAPTGTVVKLLDRNVMLRIAQMVWESRNDNKIEWGAESLENGLSITLKSKYPSSFQTFPSLSFGYSCYRCGSGGACRRGYCSSCCWGGCGVHYGNGGGGYRRRRWWY